MRKTGSSAVNSDRKTMNAGVEVIQNTDSVDHWDFLDKIEAPMWADLSISDMINNETDDSWFETSHQFHECCSSHLVSTIFHPDSITIQEPPPSTKLPPSVSKSRGKTWGQITINSSRITKTTNNTKPKTSPKVSSSCESGTNSKFSLCSSLSSHEQKHEGNNLRRSCATRMVGNGGGRCSEGVKKSFSSKSSLSCCLNQGVKNVSQPLRNKSKVPKATNAPAQNVQKKVNEECEMIDKEAEKTSMEKEKIPRREKEDVSSKKQGGKSVGVNVQKKNGSKKLIGLKVPTSPQHLPAATIENLPEDILTNIFLPLLAKQLAQMRCVSKSWNALLSDSSFIKSHLHHSIQNNSHHMILLAFDDISATYFNKEYSIHTRPTSSSHIQLNESIKLPQSEYTSCGINVIGSVHYSPRNNDSVIHIWNPSLSSVLTLPPYSVPLDAYGSPKIFFRFDDYQVVKLMGFTGPYKCIIKLWQQVEIYSMRKGTWELITESPPSHMTNIDDGDYVCADGHDGHLHWLCDIRSDSQRIVAFNLVSKTFREIPLPHSILVDEMYYILGVLAEKLCVISCNWHKAFEVWVMEEYGVAESWVKRHVFSLFNGITWPLGFTSHNEFLFIDKGDHLVLYNPVANKTEIIGNDLPESYHKVVEYVDSLVWVTPAKHET